MTIDLNAPDERQARELAAAMLCTLKAGGMEFGLHMMALEIAVAGVLASGGVPVDSADVLLDILCDGVIERMKDFGEWQKEHKRTVQ